MARTWSVPQRGSVAAVGGLEEQQNGSLLEHAIGRGFGRRLIFLLVAASLTAVGAAIPHLDLELLSTMLFVAGAGLAGIVIFTPWQSVSLSDRPLARELHKDVTSASVGTGRQMRFPELLTGGTAQSGVDRAAWAKLTAHMSHELRTPLNAVLGFSEIMSNEVFGPLGAGYGTYARDIHTSGRVLLKSAEDALAITALLTEPERKCARETSGLRAIIEDACAFVTPDLSDRCVALTVVGSADAEILGCRQASRQLLINLLLESARSASKGTAVRIETTSTYEAVNLSVAVQVDGINVPSEDSFGMILARTLCDLSSAEMRSVMTRNGEWTCSIRFPRAVQADLFAAA